jgi:hypothetical protein
MKQFRITNGFDNLVDSELLARAKFIKGKMTDSPHFPQPVPALSVIEDLINDFDAAIEKAASGDSQEKRVKNDIRQNLINNLHLLSNYVLFSAAGSRTIATSSGYTINKQGEQRPPLEAPEVKVKNGRNRGELEVKFKRVPGALSYLYEITETPVTEVSEWDSRTGTTCKYLFSGLPSAREYSFRVVAIGPRSQMVYSDVVSRVAL